MISKIKENYCHLQYIPNLAAAQLIATCRQNGIKTKLVKGQTRYFKDIFVKEQDELINLLNSLNEKDIITLKKQGRKNVVFIYTLLKRYESKFKLILKNCQLLASGKLEEHYLNNNSVINLLRIKNGMFELYNYCYESKKIEEFSITKNIFNEIKKQKPDVVAFSLMDDADPILDAIKKVKEELDIPIIIGGSISRMIGINNIPKYALNKFGVKYFIYEDGIKALPMLVDCFNSHNGDLSKVPNLYYKANNNIKHTFQEPQIDYNKIPLPDFEDFDLDDYFFPERLLPMSISSVCYWKKCAFCGELPSDMKYIKLNNNRFVEIVKHYRDRYKSRYIEIQSTCSSPYQIKEYMQSLIDNKVDNVNFSIMCRFEKPFINNDYAKTFYKGGIRYVMLGLESASQKILDLMRKGTKVEDMKTILWNFHNTGIANLCYVMAGFPGETKKDFEKTISFLNKNHEAIAGIIVTPFNLFKNSYIANNPSEFGIKRTLDNSVNPTTLLYESDFNSNEKSIKLIQQLKNRVELGKIKIHNERFNRIIDQWHLEDISGHESLHHQLFYQAVNLKK